MHYFGLRGMPTFVVWSVVKVTVGATGGKINYHVDVHRDMLGTEAEN